MTAGAYYPLNPFAEWTGDASVSTDGGTLTAGPAGARTPWKDTGSTLHDAAWAATGAGTMHGRSYDMARDFGITMGPVG